jgi:hypothetical protein
MSFGQLMVLGRQTREAPARRRMLENEIRHLAVAKGETTIGLVSMRDVLATLSDGGRVRATGLRYGPEERSMITEKTDHHFVAHGDPPPRTRCPIWSRKDS